MSTTVKAIASIRRIGALRCLRTLGNSAGIRATPNDRVANAQYTRIAAEIASRDRFHSVCSFRSIAERLPAARRKKGISETTLSLNSHMKGFVTKAPIINRVGSRAIRRIRKRNITNTANEKQMTCSIFIAWRFHSKHRVDGRQKEGI